METLKRMPFKARKAVFEKLEEVADVASLSKEERRRYENNWQMCIALICACWMQRKRKVVKKNV